MRYKTILVQLDIDASAIPRLSFAWDLARRFDANLIGFCAAEPHMLVPGDVDGTAAVGLVQEQVEEIEGLLKAREAEFRRLAGDSDRASWRSEVGEPTRFLVLHSRAADLVVMGQSHEWNNRNRTVDPGELILSSGRPILFARRDHRPMTAENVLVAWKDTREARRAIADAMPFLIGARQVLVAATDEGERAVVRDSVADVAGFLTRHGVKARSEVLDVGRADTSEALLQASVEIGADLTISGGYGHSRLREWIFGGVTRAFLADASVNRLMSS
jgi:nucleotide-binding universal stress UspA family protein